MTEYGSVTQNVLLPVEWTTLQTAVCGIPNCKGARLIDFLGGFEKTLPGFDRHLRILKIKLNLSLCFSTNQWRRDGMKAKLQTFVTWALTVDGQMWSYCSVRFNMVSSNRILSGSHNPSGQTYEQKCPYSWLDGLHLSAHSELLSLSVSLLISLHLMNKSNLKMNKYLWFIYFSFLRWIKRAPDI
jgi:hypothetical protein